MSAGVICLLPLSSTGTTQSSWDRVSEAPASAASHLVNYHRKTINLEDKCQSVVWGGGFLLFLLKHKQWRSNQLWINPKLCNEGNAVWTNSVITARPEMNVGRVKSLWSVLGLRGLFGGKKKKVKWMVAPSHNCLAKDQSESFSVKGSFSLYCHFRRLREMTQTLLLMETASGPAGENRERLSPDTFTKDSLTSYDDTQAHCRHLAFQ